jgi:hypothetical protein
VIADVRKKYETLHSGFLDIPRGCLFVVLLFGIVLSKSHIRQLDQPDILAILVARSLCVNSPICFCYRDFLART